MTATPPHPIIPGVIRVEHGRDGQARLTIDGEPFPYVFSIFETSPVSVDIVHDHIPGVRLTLLAKSVEVFDRYLAGANLADGDEDGASTTRRRLRRANPASQRRPRWVGWRH